MGQVSDKADGAAKPEDKLVEETGGLREEAVAIDPPPRGALGIRELLELLEKEVGREFPAGAANPPASERPAPDPARKRA